MESQASPAEDLPAVYRSILDGVLELEQMGNRREAQIVRARATAVYSGSWDARAHRRLLQIRQRIDRVLEGRERARTERAWAWPVPLRLPSAGR